MKSVLPNAAPSFRNAHRAAVATCIAFMLLLFAPLAMVGLGIGRDEQIMRDWEFRLPSPLPPLPLGRADVLAFPWRWDAYWSDAFPYRSRLIQLQALVRHRLLAANAQKKIFLQDGFVFDMKDIDQYRGKGLPPGAELDAFLRILCAKRDFFQKAGNAYYFVLAPNRVDFHRDVVPAAFRLPERNALAAQIRERLTPDLREFFILPDTALRAAQARWPDRPLYYHRDGHWNQWGRIVAAAAIVQHVRQAFPSLPALDPAAVPVVVAPEDQTFWGDVRLLGLPFDALPPAPTVLAAPAWTEKYRRLAAETNRCPLSLAYTSDSFMEILSDRPPEILSFGRVAWLGLSQFDRLNSPENCRVAIELKPDVVLEGKALGALDFGDYLLKNAAWLPPAATP